MTYTYEIFLRHSQIGKVEWNELILQVAEYLDTIASWEIFIRLEQNVVHYYLHTPRPVPASLNLVDFLLKPCAAPDIPNSTLRGCYRNDWNDNFATILQELYKRQCRTVFARLSLCSLKKFICGHIEITYVRNQKTYTKRLLLFSPSTFLSVNFDHVKNLLYKKFPKYLKLEKVTALLTPSCEQALLEIDPFPYFEDTQYLELDRYDFAKHSLVIGGSGSGKSRFLASFVHKISQLSAEQYKVVVIDPHDAFYQDCVEIPHTKITNFQTEESSINLFSSTVDDINASVELLLTLFRSLINDSYNGRLERVLRYTTYLLITAHQFSFIALRKLLLDLEYRNAMIKQYQSQVPASVSHFFLTDFNELKTQHYNDAIAPIIAFIDEMQMIPVFSSENISGDLAQIVSHNFLSIFSLNRLKLGDKVTKTIAGLLMQQLFLLAQQHLAQHLIIIIDEVAVVENPIITRFLAEMRKYNTSIILAGQYFDQITPELRSAIFANTTNYYLFRTSQKDATLLTENLKIKIEGSENIEDSQKALTGLKDRECLVQISSAGEILPIFKAHTASYEPAKINSCTIEQLFNYQEAGLTRQAKSPATTSPPDANTFPIPTASTFQFDLGDVDIGEVAQAYSTSRKTKEPNE